MTGEERVAHLEARVEEHGQRLAEISHQVRHLDQKLDSRFDALSSRIEALDRKLEKRADGLDSEIKTLVNRLDDHFKWLVGINVTMWAATVAAIFVSMSILLARLS